MQPATIYPTLDLCTMYPLRMGGPKQSGIRSLPDTSTHGQQWELSPRPSDLESNALTTGPRVQKKKKKKKKKKLQHRTLVKYENKDPEMNWPPKRVKGTGNNYLLLRLNIGFRLNKH